MTAIAAEMRQVRVRLANGHIIDAVIFADRIWTGVATDITNQVKVILPKERTQ